MSKCRELDPLFAPYADGEVAAADRASVESHLDRCPPCRENVAEQRTVRAAVAACRPSLRSSAPNELRARCAAHALSAPPRRSFAGRLADRPWIPLSLAATLVIAVAAAFIIGVNDKVEAIAAQLTLDHIKCFQFAPERLKHIDGATAAHQWAEKQGWTIAVPDSSASAGLELLGVRRCAMSSGRVAHVMYMWHGHPLSMFVVPRAIDGVPDRQEFVEKFGHEAVIWSGKDRTYVLLARARPTELAPVIGYVRQIAR
ncbi:MAG TPA: zf-HC2 domain-containing protein [Vicinamibacterales bacterium]|nr:zf-HC2 domain-containing protein [Vicinamibacterales bacterium]